MFHTFFPINFVVAFGGKKMEHDYSIVTAIVTPLQWAFERSFFKAELYSILRE